MADEPWAERRVLLGSVGLLAAAAAVPGLGPSPAHARAADLRSALTAWTLDTMTGLAVFVMPGPDAHSRRQGTPRPEPGGVEASLPAFLVDTLDRYLPAPDLPAGTLAGALMRGAPVLLRDARREASERAPGTTAGLSALLENDATIPLSWLVALVLNVEALRVDPRSIAGPFLAPFPRLSFRSKARVFALLEGADPDLVATIDAHLPEPLKRSASGLLRYLGGALLELSALGGYSEWGVFDPATRRLTGRPVGWRVSGYMPAAEGRPEFRGYYQGRTEATG